MDFWKLIKCKPCNVSETKIWCTYQEIAKQFQNCGLHYLHAFGSKNSRPLYVHLSGKIVFPNQTTCSKNCKYSSYHPLSYMFRYKTRNLVQDFRIEERVSTI